ncbi:MAG: prolyl oligopeptidase family serine peptidase [Sphingomonadales bacterium]|nr:prolyl oligopeptidase family serine peptidase [Sphingomonadales bacterium]
MRMARVIGTATLALLANAPARTTHPVAVDFYHGTQVRDPQRWLEDGKEPAVKAWVAAQNATSRSVLDANPDRPAIAAELKWIDAHRSVSFAALDQAGGRLFALMFVPGAQQPKLVTLPLSADPAARADVLDPLKLAPDGGLAIDWFVPSPDGTLVAVSLSANGSEDGTLHVYEVATGKEVEAPVPHVQYPTAGGSLAWTADGKGYWYTRFPGDDAPAEERHFNQSAWFHRLGVPHADDVRVLGPNDGVPRTGEIFLTNPEGAGRALASVQLGDGGEWQHFLLGETGAEKAIGYDAKVKAATLARDGTLYAIAMKDSPNGAVVRFDPGKAAPTVLVAPSDTALLTGAGERSLVVAGGHLWFTAIDGGPTRLLRVPLGGGAPETVPTPDVSTVSDLLPMPGGDMVYRVRGYLRPSAVLRWSAASQSSVETPIRNTTPVDLSGYAVSRLTATSKDGTPIPVTLIEARDAKHDGTMPTLLYGYGGFGISSVPSLLSPMAMLWLKSGGAWAIANIRGGGEYGERWHRAGMLTAKQAVFDDFAAAATLLKTRKVTSASHLALMGGSNGGLLMGATLTQHPAIARAVLSQVGIYDMLRTELDPNGSFNVAEYGSVKDPAQFAALYAYSPLHHVRPGVQYPAVLLMTGDNDGRVNPMHSRKFAAALQASGSKAPVLLRTSAKAGHGMGSSLDEQVALTADGTAFLFTQLGMRLKPVH